MGATDLFFLLKIQFLVFTVRILSNKYSDINNCVQTIALEENVSILVGIHLLKLYAYCIISYLVPVVDVIVVVVIVVVVVVV
jgi:hypothetical protein